MNTVTLKVSDQAIAISNLADASAPSQMRIAYDPKLSIGKNLENIRVALVGIDFDAIIIENPLSYTFSDTVVGLNHQRIDIGLALMNMFNKPVVAAPTVRALGLKQALEEKREHASWHLDYYGEYTGARNFGQEAMLTIGNGYLGLRGAYVEANADSDNYPGFYVAGMYDQATTKINDQDIVNEDLVNLPNAQYLSFAIDHGQRFTIKKSDITDIYRSLNLKTGQLRTTMLVALATGHQMMIETTKIADMQHYHQFTIRYRLTPLNFAGKLSVFAGIDGTVTNQNVARYAPFDQQHLNITGLQSDANLGMLTGTTKHSHLDFAITSRFDVHGDVTTKAQGQKLLQQVDLNVAPGVSVIVEKTVGIYTSRETPEDVNATAWQHGRDGGFNEAAAHTQQFLQNVWAKGDVQVTPDVTSQKLLRVNIFQLYVSGAALATGDLDASIGARGLHGEAYRGHIFWDELYMMPYLAAHAPAIARAMLTYRANRLPQAKKAAQEAGYQGAMYPWQSGTDGSEQSQHLHLNPLTNQFDPDESNRQRHVSLAIAYDVWLYDHLNQDADFMHAQGEEMVAEIGKFWLSKAAFDPTTKRYHIKGVMGPDEFHENYPHAKDKGLTDNAYTNVMVAWLFKWLQQLQPAALTKAQLKQMDHVRRHLTLDINDDGIIGQFAGYFKLAELNFDDYHKQYGDISRLDRILKAEGKTPDAYQVAKQADSLMAFYLLDEPVVHQLITEMGYHLPKDYAQQNLQYYLDRTTHGSTLSRIVYALLDARAGRVDQSWSLYHQALLSDYYDIQGGTTAEGLHLGVMGATIDVATRVYAGVDPLGEELTIDPKLPKAWTSMQVTQDFHGTRVVLTVTAQAVAIIADHDITVDIQGQQQRIQAGNMHRFMLRKDDAHDQI
ncbi:glycoside hydrolase family 65 protein [Lacticaseibacillus porcinae]|uniref:glycoside hydrolase family 65 protein n=1 Tax=Lacticaseibacillus porcinae TaxID=1123687 RepID=UPI000F79973B|nr:glycosyl hydrolase family 65 protein [Lacticaseibacillus porcinae]